MDNRKSRRAKKSLFVKELRNATFDVFENVTTPEAVEKFSRIKIGTFREFWRNSIYPLQVFVNNDTTIIGIRRHDQKASCPWSHRQEIKNFILGPEKTAVEFMPPHNELIDQANMFWLYSSEHIDNAYKECNLFKPGKQR